eukprot:11349069-Ditylum_brightwellii.AAC.1
MFCQSLQAVISGQNITDTSRKDALIKNLLCGDTLRLLKMWKKAPVDHSQTLLMTNACKKY